MVCQNLTELLAAYSAEGAAGLESAWGVAAVGVIEDDRGITIGMSIRREGEGERVAIGMLFPFNPNILLGLKVPALPRPEPAEALDNPVQVLASLSAASLAEAKRAMGLDVNLAWAVGTGSDGVSISRGNAIVLLGFPFSKRGLFEACQFLYAMEKKR